MPNRGRTRLLAALAAASATLAAATALAAPAQAAARSPVAHSPAAGPKAPHPATINLKSWGDDSFGQLGYPGGNQALPADVHPAHSGPCDAAGMSSIKQIAAGDWSSMALLRNGIVCSWGRNDFGELGRGPGPTTDIPGPVCAPYSTTFPCVPLRAKAIAAGGLFGMAILRDPYRPNGRIRRPLRDAVVTFGAGMSGELGQGPAGFANTDVPKLVCAVISNLPTNGRNCPQADRSASAFLTGATQVSGGEYNAMALVAGKVDGWGDNTSCELGAGNFCTPGRPGGQTGPYLRTCHVVFTPSPTDCSPDPVQALIGARRPIANVKAISAGNGLSTVLLNSGQVMSYGANYWEQLGNGHNGVGSPGPDVCFNNNASPPLAISCSWFAGFVNSNPSPSSPCFSATGRLSGVTAISAGFPDGMALLSDGIVCIWGTSTYGNLGAGPTASSNVPIPVCAALPSLGSVSLCPYGQYLTGAIAIAAGGRGNNLALVRGPAGTAVAAWGNNSNGQIGQGTLVPSTVSVPVLVRICASSCTGNPYLTGITQIASGAVHELALP